MLMVKSIEIPVFDGLRWFNHPFLLVETGQIEFRALVFIPSTMPFELTRDMFSPEGRAMRLYVKRVFINDKFEEIPDVSGSKWKT